MSTSRSARGVFRTICFLWAFFAIGVTLNAQPAYTIRAGGAVEIPTPSASKESVRELSATRVRATRKDVTVPGIVVGHDPTGEHLMVAASLLTQPGDYAVTLPAGLAGAPSSITLRVEPRPFRFAQPERPPAILLNGWQVSLTGSCPVSPDSSSTFGDLETTLTAGGASQVIFFDNCVEDPKGKIEDLGNRLGDVIQMVMTNSGASQVDLVAHSMGGLISRAYLSGVQVNGDVLPPADPHVRKLVAIATPNFGSYTAANYKTLLATDPQALQMIPGSNFLWNLDTWNQFSDDLRDVDVLALAGNKGSQNNASQPPAGASDGIVAVTSASMMFARSGMRSRALPYCHITSSGLTSFVMNCSGTGIAMASETHQAVQSFLEGSSGWQQIGTPVNVAPATAQLGGIYAAAFATDGSRITDLTGGTFGSTPLDEGALTGTVFYLTDVMGSGALALASPAPGGQSCGLVTPPPTFTSVYRCKSGPVLDSVGPLRTDQLGKVIASGGEITLAGSNLGSNCSTCQVMAFADAAPMGMALNIVSWDSTSIHADLPANFTGLVRFEMHAKNGNDTIQAMASSTAPADLTPRISSVTNGASQQDGIPGWSWFTIKGINLAATARIWTLEDFNGDALPLSLDGVGVTVAGAQVAVYYISPTQINALALAPTGDTANVLVTNANGETEPFLAKTPQILPGMFPFAPQNNRYVAGVNYSDGTYLGPADLFKGSVSTRPALPGETVLLFGTGFGPTSPQVPELTIFSGAAPTTNPVTMTIGGMNATVSFAGISSNGLYQFNVVVPNLAPGDYEVITTVDGISSPSGIYIAIGAP